MIEARAWLWSRALKVGAMNVACHRAPLLEVAIAVENSLANLCFVCRAAEIADQRLDVTVSFEMPRPGHKHQDHEHEPDSKDKQASRRVL